MSELVKASDVRGAVLKPPIGLLIATGAEKPERGPGRELPFFRFKAGGLEQYADAAEKARDVYGPEPAVLDDLLFLANSPGLVLDIRLRCWSQAGLRGYGVTNYAAITDDTEFLQRAWAFDDEFVFRPRTAEEVRPELRDEWQGESIVDELTGPLDPRVKRLEIHVEATLSFCMPRVMGLGTVAIYSTRSRHNIKRLRSGVWSFYLAFGSLVGYPVQLERRPRRTERFDAKERAYKVTTVHETLLKTAFTLDEVMQKIRERQETIVAGAERLALPAETDARSQLLLDALNLPLPDDDETHLREEPSSRERPTEAQLNRIARLERDVGPGVGARLFEPYGVGSAEELTEEQAAEYEQALTDTLGRGIVDGQAEELF